MVESSAEKAPSYFCSCGHAESEHRRLPSLMALRTAKATPSSGCG